MADDKRIATPYFRASFPHVFEKHKQPNGEMKFSITMLFPQDANLDALKALAMETATAKFGSDLAGLESPFKDGNEKAKKYPGHANMIVIEARTDYKPGVRNAANTEDILVADVSPDGFYPGCWARAKVNAFAWENSGRRGVSFGLSNLQKVKDDESFATTYDPSDDFDAVPNTAGADTGGAEAGGAGWLG